MIPRALQDMIKRGVLGHATLVTGPDPLQWGEVTVTIRAALGVASADTFELVEPPKIADLRRMLERVHLKPNQSSYVLVSVAHVDRWSPEVANALLKTLEEPPAHVRFLLYATDESSVLPTIRSRSARFRLSGQRTAETETEIPPLLELAELPLHVQFDRIARLVEQVAVEQVLRAWISGSTDRLVRARLLKWLRLAGDRPVNKRLLLDTIILEQRVTGA
ncbi:MAG: hypothetical protein ACOYBJ_01585 [Patescibacteria group bacterium]|jgi:hypothetical protein